MPSRLLALVSSFALAACTADRAPNHTPAPDEVSVAAPDPDSVRLHGTVRIVDDAERTPSAGSVELWLNYTAGYERHAAEVRDGEWFADVPRGFSDLEVGRLTLDGRSARCDELARAADASGGFALTARPTRDNVLRVFVQGTDREFRGELDIGASDDEVLPDFSMDWHGRGLPSPFVLPEFDERGIVPGQWYGKKRWWVRAPGYAWQSVDVDHALGGERRVELTPAGVLIVNVAEGTLREGLSVSLARGREETRQARWAPPEPDPWIFESLAPGDYRVIVERMTRPATERIAELDARVETGEATELAIDLTPRPAAPGERTLFGTITLAPEWESASFQIQLARLDGSYQWIDSPRVSLVEPNVWRWEAGLRERGRYMAYVRPFLASFVFDYDPASASNFALVIPPPADVCVKLIDKLTGEPVRDVRVGWYGMPPSEPSSITPENAPFDRARDGYCFRASAGDIVLNFSDAEQSIRFEPARVKPGENTVAISYAPLVRVRCFAVRDGKRVPWPESVMVSAVEPTEPKHFRGSFRHEFDLELGFDAAGKYELRAASWLDDADERYEPVTATVEALRERVVEVEFPLKRVD